MYGQKTEIVDDSEEVEETRTFSNRPYGSVTTPDKREQRLGHQQDIRITLRMILVKNMTTTAAASRTSIRCTDNRTYGSGVTMTTVATSSVT